MIGKCFFRPRTWRSGWPSPPRAIRSGSISASESLPSTTTSTGGLASSAMTGALLDSIVWFWSSTSGNPLADVHLAVVVLDRGGQARSTNRRVQVATGELVGAIGPVELRNLLPAG